MPIYFISNNNDRIKIGCSADPQKRLKDLQTASAYELTLVAMCPGGTKTEAELHERFSDLRTTGEWFKIDQSLELLIKHCQEEYPQKVFDYPDRDKWDDAFNSWCVAGDDIDTRYDAEIDALERKIDELNARRDNELDKAEKIFDDLTRGIDPIWLREDE